MEGMIQCSVLAGGRHIDELGIQRKKRKPVLVVCHDASCAARGRFLFPAGQSPQPEPTHRAPLRLPSLPHPYWQQTRLRRHDGVSASQSGPARSAYPPPATPSRAPAATIHRLRANAARCPQRSVRMGRWSSSPTRLGAGPLRFGANPHGRTPTSALQNSFAIHCLSLHALLPNLVSAKGPE